MVVLEIHFKLLNKYSVDTARGVTKMMKNYLRVEAQYLMYIEEGQRKSRAYAFTL